MTNKSDKMDGQLEKMVQWVDSWEEATKESRAESERDRDYYDGNQWTSEEQDELKKRGQPVVTINRIAKKINYLTGTEVRTRTDPGAVPRTAEHEQGAEAVADALRYVQDIEDVPSVHTEAFESFSVEGYGGVVVEVEKEEPPPQEEGEEEPRKPEFSVKVRPVPWDRVGYDPHSRKWNFNDAKYRFVVVWLDREDSIDLYGKDSASVIDSALANSESTIGETTDDRPRHWADGKTERVKVVEMYYRRGRDWYFCHFTRGGFLAEPKKVPLVDDKGKTICPLIMAGPFVDRENSRYGLVRNMISPQDEINKRRSKALHLLSMRQIIMDEGAADPNTVSTEMAKPDGIVVKKPGLDLAALPTGDMAQAQFQLLQEAKGEIDTIGPDAGIVAGSSQGQSGRAVLARQQMASLELETAFDRWRWLKKQTYRHIWYAIRQFWTHEKWFRVRDDDDRKGFRFVGLNQTMAKGERLQQLLGWEVPLQQAAKQLGVEEALAQIMQMVQQQAQMLAQQQGQPPPPKWSSNRS